MVQQKIVKILDSDISDEEDDAWSEPEMEPEKMDCENSPPNHSPQLPATISKETMVLKKPKKLIKKREKNEVKKIEKNIQKMVLIDTSNRRARKKPAWLTGVFEL